MSKEIKKRPKRFMVKFFMDNGQEIIVSTAMNPEEIDRYFHKGVGPNNLYEHPMMVFGQARIVRNKVQSYFITEEQEIWNYDDPLN